MRSNSGGGKIVSPLDMHRFQGSRNLLSSIIANRAGSIAFKARLLRYSLQVQKMSAPKDLNIMFHAFGFGDIGHEIVTTVKVKANGLWRFAGVCVAAGQPPC